MTLFKKKSSKFVLFKEIDLKLNACGIIKSESLQLRLPFLLLKASGSQKKLMILSTFMTTTVQTKVSTGLLLISMACLQDVTDQHRTDMDTVMSSD